METVVVGGVQSSTGVVPFGSGTAVAHKTGWKLVSADGQAYPVSELGGRVRSGEHLCVLYETEEHRQRVVGAYVGHGLVLEEKVIYLAGARVQREVKHQVGIQGVFADKCEGTRQLEAHSVADLRLTNGAMSPYVLTDWVRREAQRAAQEGYTALRLLLDMSWLLREKTGHGLIMAYERRLSDTIPPNCIVMCEYMATLVDGNLMVDLIRAHRQAVIGHLVV